MLDVLISYPFLFFKRKISVKTPTLWEELTEPQFIAISRTINGSDPDLRFLSVFTGIAVRLLKKLSPFQLHKLSEGIQFIATAGHFHHSFFILKTSGLYCPKTRLNNLTFAQFIFAESHYNDWQLTKNMDSLNKLVASLYLLPGAKFNSETIHEKLKLISRISPDIRKAIAFNFGLVLIWLSDCYPLLFNSDEKKAVPDKNKPRQSVWIKLFDSIVGDDLINRDRYADIPLHTVFRYLTSRYKENLKHN